MNEQKFITIIEVLAEKIATLEMNLKLKEYEIEVLRDEVAKKNKEETCSNG